MKKIVSAHAKIILAFLLLLSSCKKEAAPEIEITINPVLKLTEAPIANAGNDTVIYLPFNSVNLSGALSKDPDGVIVSYNWKKIAGPSKVDIIITDKIKAFASGLRNVGNYKFELTVTDADNVSSKDTIQIAVLERNCFNTKEVIIKDLSWDFSWIMDIAIYNFSSYLEPHSHLKNIYIKRDFSNDWELVVPEDIYSPNHDKEYNWSYGNGVLVIYPGLSLNKADDTPDIKLEYCN